MKSLYRYYKNRLIEISGKNRSLYAKNVSKKYAYDLGKILDGDYDLINSFVDFLWKGKRAEFNFNLKNFKENIFKNFKINEKFINPNADDSSLVSSEKTNEQQKIERLKREEVKKVYNAQIVALTRLKREVEEFATDTGRYEMFIGYPFVEGALNRDILIKAPLLLFPIIINIENDNSITFEIKSNEPVQLNKVLVLAYAKEHNLNLEGMMLEFENLCESKLNDINAVLNYLSNFGISLSHSNRKGIFDYNRAKEPKIGDGLEVKHLCVVGRFPLANSIYNDYTILERKGWTSEPIEELIASKRNKGIKKPNNNIYSINKLDYAQEYAIEKLNANGNMVIYGPPGTGKSQTIVNIISDAICKNKRVLVVSQKRSALDVVYNRLGNLNSQAILIPDAEKNKVEFYDRVKTMHLATMQADTTYELQKFDEIQAKINNEIKDLETISDVLFTPTSFGISLQEMYAKSQMIGKNTNDYKIYQNLLKNKKLMAFTYQQLEENIKVIEQKNKATLYYKHMEIQYNNPLIDHIKNDLDMHLVISAKMFLSNIVRKNLTPFDMGKSNNARQLLTFYLENDLQEKEQLKPIIKVISKVESPKLYKSLNMSKVFFLAYPFVKYRAVKKENEIFNNFDETLKEVKEYVADFSILERVLDKRGYSMTIDNVLNGNNLFLKLLLKALESYVDIRDLNIAIKSLTREEELILSFAYQNSSTLNEMNNIVNKLLTIRTYHEIIILEDEKQKELSLILNFDNLRNRIQSLKKEQKKLALNIGMKSFKKEYIEKFDKDLNNKNYLYQISKQQNLWSIRRLMDSYKDYLLTLFPCWLLSPESVSNIMPLEAGLFDLILFDEASQVFIENTIPTIFRGKYIVVAGDNKQLRPSSTFVKRYMGADEENENENLQVALEVESLLDLATSHYNSTHLTYHYRSKSEELINFSNYAFYDGRLEIAPNPSKNKGQKPIERIMVDGRWIDRHNELEAKEVVKLVKKILKTRKNKETIGVITFNTEQESYIEDLLDLECQKDEKFREQFLAEKNRIHNGEDISFFVKNLENVQGDERDIIIFCIGYAKNEYDRVMAQFGPLSLEGGENRLNVAVTRAKSKIYVVTSIEPEELNVETSKNAGPKLFKKYLEYVRAVSKGRDKDVEFILNSLKQTDKSTNELSINPMEMVIKEELEKLGYTVDTNVGNADYKISLAVYDNVKDKYVLGIECDWTAYNSSNSILERDVYRLSFLESRGWNMVRVWSRDLWLNKQRVIKALVKEIGKNSD